MRPSLAIRPATLVDLEPVCEMLWDLTLEERAHITTRYPILGPETRDEILNMFRTLYSQSSTHTEIADDNGRYAGFASATIVPRPTGNPKAVIRLDTIYLAPAYRATFGHLSTCKQLVGAIWEWGQVAIRPYLGAEDQPTIEGAYIPGGSAQRLWEAAGLKPYLSLCAWVREDGTPNLERMKRYIGDTP